MPLPGDQNSEESIRLLAAFSYEYSRAKRTRGIRIIISILIALAAPLAAFQLPTATSVKNLLAIAGGGWLLLSVLILKRIEVAWIKRAATIQEEFDFIVLGLPWNNLFVGDHVSQELIRHADGKFRCTKKRNRLENWYPETDAGFPLNVLLCQRANLVWDWRLRKSYSYFIGLLTALLFISGIIIAIITDQKMIDYILRFFTPSLAVLVLGIETAWANYDMAGNKERKEKSVNSLVEQARQNPDSVTISDCRRLQDYIFSLRSKDPLIPNWWYRIFRTDYEAEMRQTVQDFQRSL